jgi:hypothetical protein
MPFIGKDWRSGGEQWIRTEHGWERLKVLECILHNLNLGLKEESKNLHEHNENDHDLFFEELTLITTPPLPNEDSHDDSFEMVTGENINCVNKSLCNADRTSSNSMASLISTSHENNRIKQPHILYYEFNYANRGVRKFKFKIKKNSFESFGFFKFFFKLISLILHILDLLFCIW